MQTTQQKLEARVTCQPGFAWDAQDAYLFDIDGTLLRSRDRVHVDSVAASVRGVTGLEVTLEGLSIHGHTDTGILREACANAGIPAELLEPQVAAILEAMCQHVASRREQLDLYLMPGVQEALSHLAARGALLGVATGNLETIGWIKIEVAGLREWFRFGGFSDRFPVRSAMIGHAARKARELAGETATVCVVGDTPRDIEAARANHLPVIAVATGHFSFDQLIAFEPEVCATSLADLVAATQVAP
ncbi:MAG TPA: HAD family hydrolase [Terracidiphilus sp.]|jgi:phosphoglycolate phosphatase-like HAD superfamily hydrolase|nr:HAD family hydrolase [Terracidiphilus sp.]